MLLQQLMILAPTTNEKVFSKSLFIHYFHSYHRRPKSKIRLLSQVPDEWLSKQDLETQEHPHVARCCYELSSLQLKYMQHKQNWHFIHRFISPPHHRLEAVLVAELIFLPPHSSSNRTCLSSLLSTRLQLGDRPHRDCRRAGQGHQQSEPARTRSSTLQKHSAEPCLLWYLLVLLLTPSWRATFTTSLSSPSVKAWFSLNLR